MSYSITVDIRMWSYSGIGRYLQNLLPRVVRSLHQYKFFLLLNPLDTNSITSSCPEAKLIPIKAPIYSFKEQLMLPYKAPETDLFWSPHYNIPIFNSSKLLTTIHDLAPLHLDHFRSSRLKQLYANYFFKAVCQKSSHIITVSQFTRNKLLKFNQSINQKTTAIHNGIDPTWQPVKASPLYPIPYFLYIGNIKPHKNLKRLVRSFLRCQNSFPHFLILAGEHKRMLTTDHEILTKIEKAGDRIKFLGHVNENDLKNLYTHAEALLFPSLYEGFGFPPLEAMATQTPVLTSNCTSLPEICQDAALYVNPKSEDEIELGMKRMATDASLKADLIQKGKENVQKYSWDDCAQQTSKIIKDLVS